MNLIEAAHAYEKAVSEHRLACDAQTMYDNSPKVMEIRAHRQATFATLEQALHDLRLAIVEVK